MMRARQNAYASKGKILKELQRMEARAASDLLLISQLPVGYIPEGFPHHPLSESPIYHLALFPARNYSSEEFEESAKFIMAENNYLNHSKGHKIGTQRKKRGARKAGQITGKGFSFRPEIPWIPKPAHTKTNGKYEDLAEQFENLFHPRYCRKNHEAQTMPKVEWHVEREWRNKIHKPYLTSSDSEFYRQMAEAVRQCIAANPRQAFGRDRHFYY